MAAPAEKERFLQLLRMEENETKRIARELHHDLTQFLGNIKLDLERSIREIGEIRVQSGMESLNIALTKTQQAIDETQKIGFHLWPPTLEDAHLGILPTISWFCREFQQAHPNICVDVKVDINEDEVNDSLKPAAYKLLRDALNNTKCCKASLVHVFFLRKGHKVVLTIQDDGQGFDMEKEGSTDSGFAWSFDIMKERAEITGGSFSIESAIGKETRIHVSWPT